MTSKIRDAEQNKAEIKNNIQKAFNAYD